MSGAGLATLADTMVGTAADARATARSAAIGAGPQVLSGHRQDGVPFVSGQPPSIIAGPDLSVLRFPPAALWPETAETGGEPSDTSGQWMLRFDVWDSERLQAQLAQPMGSPVRLNLDEAREIIKLAFGRRPDLPAGGDYVEAVREDIGHALFDRLNRSDG